MPLYREWQSDPFSLAAIWKIEEPEAFFTARTGIQSDIKADKRRVEHLAGRFLLQYLKHDFPLLHIRPDSHDKPRLPENVYYFSVSHSYPYVAAVVSRDVESGIDIQTWHPRMERLQFKFLNEAERHLMAGDIRRITQAWCVKEAAYKWQGRRGVEFADHLLIQQIAAGMQEAVFSVQMVLLESQPEIQVVSFTDEEFSFALVVHQQVFHPVHVHM